MQKLFAKYIGCSIIGMVLLCSCSFADKTELREIDHDITIAILPIRNLTLSSDIENRVSEKISAEFDELNIKYISSDALRPTLRKNRIRTAGQINNLQAELISKAVHFDYFLISTIDFLEDNGIPELGVTMRLVSPTDLTLKAAIGLSANGQDYEKMFGVGIIEDVNALMDKVIHTAISDLMTTLNRSDDKRFSKGRMVLIPFNNSSENRYAGQICSNWLLIELFNDGFDIIEPGIVNELITTQEGMPAGEIDLIRLTLLKENLRIDKLITGEVDRFRQANGTSKNSYPDIELGARLIDVKSGMISATYNMESTGIDHESFFQLGRKHALGKLLEDVLHKTVIELEKQRMVYGKR